MTTETHPVAAAVEPARESAVAHATESARNYIAGIMDKIAAMNGDINAAFPYVDACRQPNCYITPVQKGANRARIEVEGFVTVDEERHYREGVDREQQFFNGVRYVTANEAAIARFYKQVEDQTNASFTAFVKKMVGKVGDCDSASMEGRIWHYSILTVTKGETVERWKTQMIVNVSCRGKVFNQFPTRKVKR